jgi:aryl-alcohol dehydrogenase-like predicted oxidoreductase
MNMLGRAGLPVSRLGLGLAALGRPGYINLGHADDLHRDYRVETMEERAAAVLDAAHAAGIRYLDAARSYGRAEAFLAAWLERRGHPPGSITVGSKWGYTYTAGWRVAAEHHEVKDHSRAVFGRQLGESRALLGAHLQLYQIHSATLDSGVLDDPDTLRALAAARDEGLAIGLTLSGSRQAETLQQALAIRIDGAPLFGVVQATWNLLERSAGDALHAAHDAGLGVIIKEGLANGRLTDRNPELSPAIRRAATRAGTTIDALALAAILAQPWVDVVLSGAATVAQLHSNAAALTVPGMS